MAGIPRNPVSLALIANVASFLIGALLIRSAMFHLENNFAFLSTVYSYQLVGKTAGVLIAAILPPLQLAIGVCLFSNRRRRAALLLASVVFAVFSIVQIVTLARGLNISCGCFGPTDDSPIGWASISLATVCAAVSASAATYTARMELV